MELQYKKAMEQYNLSYGDLSEDAQTGIDGINDVIKGLKMLEKKGKNPTEKTLKKLRAMDKWVYYEIIDQLHGTDENEDEIPEDANQVVDEIQDQMKGEVLKVDKLGLEIESELEKFYVAGKKSLTFDEIKSSAKKTYDVLFKTYEEDESNGVTTNKYSLVETDKHTFTLNKK